MDALEDSIWDMDMGYVRIDGDVSINLRDEMIRIFQTDEETNIALLSISACGTGLNLTRASVVVISPLPQH